MAERTFLDDVRDAKERLNRQFPTLEALVAHLHELEGHLKAGKGPFANVPREMPERLKQEIASAEGRPSGKGSAQKRRCGPRATDR